MRLLKLPDFLDEARVLLILPLRLEALIVTLGRDFGDGAKAAYAPFFAIDL